MALAATSRSMFSTEPAEATFAMRPLRRDVSGGELVDGREVVAGRAPREEGHSDVPQAGPRVVERDENADERQRTEEERRLRAGRHRRRALGQT